MTTLMTSFLQVPFTSETALAKVQMAEDMAVRLEYEWHEESGQWYRAYRNETWEFREDSLMARRFASINDAPMREAERQLFTPGMGPAR